ncbi:MAG: NAD(P)H-binding protein [Steroidobacteraceae bacterium]
MDRAINVKSPAAPAGARHAWVFGASGLLGRRLVDALLESPEHARVIAVTRRPLGREHPRLANRIVAFEQLESQLAGITCHDAFCCLGTTRARAGSEDAFRKVDHDQVLRVARIVRQAGAERFVLVSAVGADPAAKNFYLRVKGETEAEVAALGFPALDIVQPGLLLGGSRAESRPLESTARLLMPLVNPLLGGAHKAWRGIDIGVLSQAMVALTRSGRRGVYRYTYDGLQKLATRSRSARPDGALTAPGS